MVNDNGPRLQFLDNYRKKFLKFKKLKIPYQDVSELLYILAYLVGNPNYL